MKKLLFLVNSADFFLSHRSAVAAAAWMDGLSTEDRKFVLSVARDCCEHLRMTHGGVKRKKLGG